MQTPDTRPKKFVFVLMPFSESFDDIYQVGIKPACELAGAYCERIDEQIFQESILTRLYNQISKADLVVADMTGRNPNVFYETGYAHALNKKVILLTQTANDIPFDLKHYPHIVYSGKIAVLKDELQRHVQWYLNQPDHTTVDPTKMLEYYCDAQILGDHMEVRARGLYLGELLDDYNDICTFSVSCGFQFAAHNPTMNVVYGSSLIYLLFENTSDLRNEGEMQLTRLPNFKWMLGPLNLEKLMPLEWKSTNILIVYNIQIPKPDLNVRDLSMLRMPVTVIVSGDLGSKDVLTFYVSPVGRS
jgi:hypothetical protein